MWRTQDHPTSHLTSLITANNASPASDCAITSHSPVHVHQWWRGGRPPHWGKEGRGLPGQGEPGGDTDKTPQITSVSTDHVEPADHVLSGKPHHIKHYGSHIHIRQYGSHSTPRPRGATLQPLALSWQGPPLLVTTHQPPFSSLQAPRLLAHRPQFAHSPSAKAAVPGASKSSQSILAQQAVCPWQCSGTSRARLTTTGCVGSGHDKLRRLPRSQRMILHPSHHDSLWSRARVAPFGGSRQDQAPEAIACAPAASPPVTTGGRGVQDGLSSRL